MSDHHDRYRGMEELHGTNLAEVGTDCISRQAAIDAMVELQGSTSSKGVLKGISKAWKRIKELQPIHPEIVRCEECKYHYQRNCPIEKYFSLDGFCSRGDRGTT